MKIEYKTGVIFNLDFETVSKSLPLLVCLRDKNSLSMRVDHVESSLRISRYF